MKLVKGQGQFGQYLVYLMGSLILGSNFRVYRGSNHSVQWQLQGAMWDRRAGLTSFSSAASSLHFRCSACWDTAYVAKKEVVLVSKASLLGTYLSREFIMTLTLRYSLWRQWEQHILLTTWGKARVSPLKDRCSFPFMITNFISNLAGVLLVMKKTGNKMETQHHYKENLTTKMQKCVRHSFYPLGVHNSSGDKKK